MTLRLAIFDCDGTLVDSQADICAAMDLAFAAQSLKKFPQRGRIVPELRDASVREIFVKQYRLIYEIGPNRVVVLSFLHGARQFPETI